ncbi:PDZ domain-containing protein [Microbulbifer agarilyticus]|uniref:PDZ domain-containing protein n=1 Tax=Microbulbifer agarilyticus TaxID=260552 RepID=UPI001CD3511C|nr:PDZ domain-containing protein [Microbulbifer agarilyticus]MCA0900664.1 PDZ domain-containing protein [Microbulbifer agarilyticus]
MLRSLPNIPPQILKYRIPIGFGLLVVIGTAMAFLGEADIQAKGAVTSPSLFTSAEPGQSSLEARLASVEKTLDQTLKIQGQLLELVSELSAKVAPESEAPQTRRASMSMAQSPAAIPQAHGNRQRTENRFSRQRGNQVKRLIDAGFTPERAALIIDRQERLQYEQMQYSYEYHHMKDKRSDRALALQQKIQTYSNPRRVFEQELNPAEFEQYLNAFGGRTEMEIGSIIESAPAYDAGLRAGDKIIRYNNQRVFHMGDLRTQVYQAKPGSSVEVEIQRQGSSSTETIYLPAGPLGIRG